jgi:hypothetical protein
MRPTGHPRRRGAVTTSSVLLVIVALGCTLLVARRATESMTPRVNLLADHGVVAGTDTAPSTAPTVQQAVGTAKVRDLTGKIVPLVPKGQPAIVMISSRTCPWCKRAFKDLGEMSGGRPLSRLVVFTLEGAADGVPMLEQEHLTGAHLVGPLGDADQVMLTFRYPGTPTFVAIDRNGRVVRTLPGYPIREELKLWYAVMVGDRDVP